MPPKRRYPKGVAKHDEILEVALDVFTEKGYDRTSVREVARLTGLSQAGLLHYFSSKEELFVEVLRRRDVRNEQRYDVNRGDPVTVAGLVSIVQHNTAEPGLVRLFVTMSAESTAIDNPARSFFVDRYRILRAGLAADVRRHQDAGTIAADVDADGVASVLLAAADGLQINGFSNPTRSTWGVVNRLWQLLCRQPETA